MTIGLVLTLISIIDIPYFEFINKVIPTEKLIFSAFGLLCLLLGFERWKDISKIQKVLEKIDDSINRLEFQISSSKTYNYLENHNDIYSTSIPLIEYTKTKIRTVVFTNSPKTPNWWFKEVIRILVYKSERNPIEFEVIICAKENDINDAFFEANDKRFKEYEDAGVKKYFKLYIHKVKSNFGHDVLIVDKKHVVFNFATLNAQRNHSTKGIMFKNQPELAEDMVNWYDTFVKDGAVSYEILKNDFLKKKKNKMS